MRGELRRLHGQTRRRLLPVGDLLGQLSHHCVLQHADGGKCKSSPPCSDVCAEPDLVLDAQANQFPTIRAAKSFVGLGVISSDVYTGGTGGAEEWYINQASLTATPNARWFTEGV